MTGMPGSRPAPRRGPVRALVVLAALAVTAGCTSHDSSGATSTQPPTPAFSPGALSTAVPSLPAVPPTTPSAVAAFLEAGFGHLGFAHIAFSTALSGNAMSGTGRVQLAAGQVSGLDVRARVSQVGNVRLLLVGTVPYAALPTPREPGKPYVVLGGSSGSAQLDRTAIGLQATKLLAAPATYRTLVSAAGALTLVDRPTLDGTPTLHYRGPVSVDAISSSDPVRIALGALDVHRLALDLWVDGAGRPVKASAPAPDGRTSEVTFSAPNQPFTLAKPPAAEVAR